jgi:hypothetical protein
MVLGITASLKVAVILLAIATPVAPEAGLSDEAVGGVVTAAVVVNDHDVDDIVLPDKSCAPLIVAV